MAAWPSWSCDAWLRHPSSSWVSALWAFSSIWEPYVSSTTSRSGSTHLVQQPATSAAAADNAQHRLTSRHVWLQSNVLTPAELVGQRAKTLELKITWMTDSVSPQISTWWTHDVRGYPVMCGTRTLAAAEPSGPVGRVQEPNLFWHILQLVCWTGGVESWSVPQAVYCVPDVTLCTVLLEGAGVRGVSATRKWFWHGGMFQLYMSLTWHHSWPFIWLDFVAGFCLFQWKAVTVPSVTLTH